MVATCGRCRRPIVLAVLDDGNQIRLDARARIFVLLDQTDDTPPKAVQIRKVHGSRVMIPHDVVCASLYDVEDI